MKVLHGIALLDNATLIAKYTNLSLITALTLTLPFEPHIFDTAVVRLLLELIQTVTLSVVLTFP